MGTSQDVSSRVSSAPRILIVSASLLLLAGLAVAASRVGKAFSAKADAAKVGPVVVEQSPARSAVLAVAIRGLQSQDGEVNVALYRSREDFLKRTQPARWAVLQPKLANLTWRVPDLEPGRYAVAVFHDINGNQEFDQGLFGLPAEPYGFSNSPANQLRPPDFGDASFEFSGRDLSIEVTLRSLPF